MPVEENTRMGPEEDSQQCFLCQMSMFCNNPSQKGGYEWQRPDPAGEMSALWEKSLSSG